MKLVFVYKIFPVLIITTKYFFTGFDGIAIPFGVINFIFLKEKYEGMKGNEEHEKVHIKQMLRWFIFPWLLMYFISPKFRLSMETEGYATEARYQYYPEDAIKQYASDLFNDYCLFGYERKEIEKMIIKEYNKLSL